MNNIAYSVAFYPSKTDWEWDPYAPETSLESYMYIGAVDQNIYETL